MPTFRGGGNMCFDLDGNLKACGLEVALAMPVEKETTKFDVHEKNEQGGRRRSTSDDRVMWNVGFTGTRHADYALGYSL